MTFLSTSRACLTACLFLGTLSAYSQTPAEDLHFGNVTLPTGVTLNYAEQGRGRSNVLIMLHGYLDSWFSYSEVLANLDPHIHAIAITQRGHGDSDKPLTGYAMEDFSEDIVAFMDHFGYRKVSIIGHSMGSIVAQRLAIDHPERVRKLILMGSGVNMTGNEVLRAVEEIVAPLDDPIPHEFVVEFQSGTAPNPISDAFIDTIVTESEKVPARVWRDALAGLLAADHTAEIGMIQAHTLVIWGDDDEIFPINDQEDLAAGIPFLETVTYPNLNHSPNWQRPRLIALEIMNFLRLRHPSCPADYVP